MQAVAAGYPVIIIDQFIPGIANYIESIDQGAVFLFDEFDKTFGDIRAGDNEANPQARLLSLFDGTAQGKKLFIITCNSLHRLSEFLVNRPGRFHYHFRFNYPTPEEISEYLKDKLGSRYQKEIDKVVLFSKKVSLNYDCLRAISFELSLGEPFESVIQDLNILNVDAEGYDITLYCKDGTVMTAKNQRLDLFNRGEPAYVHLRESGGKSGAQVVFCPADCAYDPVCGAMTVRGNRISFVNDDEDDPFGDKGGATSKLAPEYMTIIRTAGRTLHYLTA